MGEDLTFVELIRRVRERDADAAAELVRRYEPAIRRLVRVRMVDARLRRVLDSMDICQSVLASLFVHAAWGEYRLDTPEHLIKLLSRMVRNKVIDQVRRQRAEQRDHRRAETADSRLVAPTPGPVRQVAARELLEEVRRRLSAEERFLLERREQGREWAEIAAEAGGSPEALRKRLRRALAEAARQLDLDEFGPE